MTCVCKTVASSVKVSLGNDSVHVRSQPATDVKLLDCKTLLLIVVTIIHCDNIHRVHTCES